MDNQSKLGDPFTSYTLQACFRQIAAGPVDFTGPLLHPQCKAPGSCFDYSSVDYQVAGYVATLMYTPAPGHTRSWQDFFQSVMQTPMGGLSSYSFDYDWWGTSSSNPGYGYNPNVTNPRVGGGASCNSGDYETILRMLLNGGTYTNASGQTVRVLNSSVVSALLTNQLKTYLSSAGSNTSGLSSSQVFYSPVSAPNVQGYSFGFWIPTAAYFSGEPTKPLDPSKAFFDIGLEGAAGWIDNGTSGSAPFGAINLIDDYLGSLGGMQAGEQMANDAYSSVLCQMHTPGKVPCP
jgi:hypothetical protein